MIYQGGKYRIAKHIIPIITGNRRCNQTYVEPFIGGGIVMSGITGKRIGSDLNEYTIEALKLIRDHPELIPKNNKEFTEEDFLYYKKYHEIMPNKGMVGFVGFSYSFSGMFYHTWNRDNKGRDFVKFAYNSTMRQNKCIQGVKLVNCSYDKLEIPENSIIYCDPPYENTFEYKGVKGFNSIKFWNWCRDKIKEGHEIFVSEYQAPSDFKCIWQTNMISNLNRKNTVEKLFTIPNKKQIYSFWFK